MATISTFAHRLLLAGGFAVAVSAAPLVAAMATPAGPASPALAECPATEVLDPASGACRPIPDKAATDQTNEQLNPINPEGAALQPGAITDSAPGNVGSLPEIDGIPCTGANTGKCIGLQESNAGQAVAPKIETGVTG